MTILMNLQNLFVLGSSPGTEVITTIFNNLNGDIIAILQGMVVLYASWQGMLGFFDYMSKDQHKQSAGIDHVKRAIIGLVGVLVIQTVMTYVQGMTVNWTA